jgi:citrate synthase
MADYAKGLEGVIAAESSVCKIDGANGKLFYRGYSIEDLAAHSDFEETVYLLLNKKLPDGARLEEFRRTMRTSRDIPKEIIEMIKWFPKEGKPMELLQAAVSYLSGFVGHHIDHSSTCNCRQTLHQVVQLSSIVATYHRIKQGKEYIPARMDLSHGANFLYQLHGKEPEEFEGRIMDVCLILHAEHGFNASTFTARVVASTLSTCYSSISAAIGALYGSLHGGANERVLDMLDEIGSVDNVETWVDEAMAQKRKIMGMGHRVYKAKDPRSVVMEGFLEELALKKGKSEQYAILKKLESYVRKKMDEKGKPVYPNVDFFSGAVYSMLGIPRELYTPIFAMARVSGWLTHILEQRIDNRIYRPKSLYTGPDGCEYTPTDQR